jgi:hypothetical protein
MLKLCRHEMIGMDYNFFGENVDQFSGVIPNSPYGGQAPDISKSKTTTIVIVVLSVLFVIAAGVAAWMYLNPSSNSNLAPSASNATPFTASIATIIDPTRRAEAETLDRAYSNANSEQGRAAIRHALSFMLGDANSSPQQPQPLPLNTQQAPKASTQPTTQPPSQQQQAGPPAEPPMIYRAPEGDPNFARI